MHPNPKIRKFCCQQQPVHSGQLYYIDLFEKLMKRLHQIDIYQISNSLQIILENLRVHMDFQSIYVHMYLSFKVINVTFKQV